MTMSAGVYYVGDLCYVMTDDEWDELCAITMSCGVLEGEFTLKDGRRFAIYSTAYGDGTYLDRSGTKYPVDAGVIGCIKVSDIQSGEFDINQSGGAIHTFAKDFETFSRNGLIVIGHVSIDTDPPNEDVWYENEEHFGDTIL